MPACSTFATLAFCSVIMKSSFNPTMTTIAISLNLAATPLQLMCMPVFMDIPSKFGIDLECNVSDLITSVKTQPFSDTVATFGSCLLWAVLVWIILAPLMIIGIRFGVASVVSSRKKQL